ncbi:MAG: 4-(cytidine 5'-diphospho)-2-C-methyl-D-erythritol kinase [Terriglobia bacterium]
MEPRIRVRAFAKINVGLKILGKRADGYHEIRTVFQTVALHDLLTVTISKRGRGITLVCDEPSIPTGSDNLVYRACGAWKQASGFHGGIRIELIKKIPAGAGLGGASSDAAATLLALERLTGDQLEAAERTRIAAELGSDVPFFLFGGRALASGRGEEIVPLDDLPRRCCLIVFPGFQVSTAWAYGEAGRLPGRRLTKGRRALKMDVLGARPLFPLREWGPAENDFERVVFARWPELAKLKRQLIRAGAETASLTGSGSAVFALFQSAQKTAQASELVPRGWQCFHSRTLSGAEYRRRLTQ